MQNFETLMQQINESSATSGITEGVILALDNNYAVVDVNLKSEGLIPINEFKNAEGELKAEVGDKVAVMIELADNGYGEVFLSYEKAIKHSAWEHLNKCCETGETIEGRIIERVKGGFTVAVDPLKAFLPGSLADMRPGTELNNIEDQTLTFKVVKMDKKRSNIVVSRRAVLDEESSGEREELLSSLTEGKEVTGIVKNLTEYGAFIDLGGIDGLLHITDMSWKRVAHPSEVVTVGQSITVKVLSYDREKLRVSLGLKQLSGDPWLSIEERITVGTRLFGVVTNAKDYGCFVEIEDGIEGLVHMSEMDWCNKNIQPSSLVSPGDEVEVMVLEVDPKKRRISLGMKQCIPSPWVNFSENNEIGGKVTGMIKSITDFGLFIGLDGGIDGLVHFSDVSWSQPGDVAVRNYKKGEQVDAVILGIDSERERISLGLKQLTQDPFEDFFKQNPIGTNLDTSIIEIDQKKLIVTLENDLKGCIRLNEQTQGYKVGDSINCYVETKELKHAYLISLSIYKPKESSGEEVIIKTEEAPSNNIVAELLKAQLNDNKD